MAWTKRQLITQAFDDVGLASYVFDLTADQLESCRRRLDSMMATWNAKGIKVAYPIPTDANGSDLDQDSHLPDFAVEAVCLNLAIRIAPSVGKAVSPDLKTSAKLAYDVLLNKAAMPREMQLAGIPKGAGFKSPEDVFFPDPDTSPIQLSDNDQLILTGE